METKSEKAKQFELNLNCKLIIKRIAKYANQMDIAIDRCDDAAWNEANDKYENALERYSFGVPEWYNLLEDAVIDYRMYGSFDIN